MGILDQRNVTSVMVFTFQIAYPSGIPDNAHETQ